MRQFSFPHQSGHNPAGKAFRITLTKVREPRSDAELRPLIRNSGMIVHPKFEVPEDFTFRDVKTSRKVSLHRDLKDQVVLINVWATWCLPCVREIPSLEGLHKALCHRDLVVLGVNNEAVSTQLPYLDLYKVTFPCLVGPVNDLSFRMRNWWPQTYLIDRQGRLVASKGGPQDWAMPDVQQLIAAMLGDE
jgi:thiol-disulfide isomerase/thioredoxin